MFIEKLKLSEEMEWYSKQVSQTKLYEYFKEDIKNIIKNKEKEYYHIILELFEIFLEEENKFKIKNKIIKENLVSVMHI